MDVYLIRHGLAGESGSYPDDRERPLTEEGKKKTRLVAKRLKELALRFDLILTSPLVRAHQTAEILLDVGLSDHLELADYLAPGGAIADWVAWLSSWPQADASTLALVGHEPSLSTWAETLLWGNSQGVITLKKAGVIGLAVDPEEPIAHSSLFLLAGPKFLLSKS